MFDRKGQIVVDGKANEDATMEVALDAGARISLFPSLSGSS